MTLKSKILAHLASCEKMLKSREDIVPSWIISGADGDWLIFTRFDHDKPEQLQRLMYLMNRFMAWKLATGFVLGMEAWLGSENTREGQEALFAIGVTRAERLAVMRRIRRSKGEIALGPLEWLGADAIDGTFFNIPPARSESVTVEEARMLDRIFGEDGESPAVRMS